MANEFKLPDPVKVNQWGTQLRYTTILLGGVLGGSTWVSKISGINDADFNQYVMIAVTVVSFLLWLGPATWGWMNNYFYTRDVKEVIVASSVASAESGTAVVVDVVQTGKGINNIALPVKINATEVSNAAVVPPGAKILTTEELNRLEIRRQHDEAVRR